MLKYDSADTVKSAVSHVRFPLLAQKYIEGRRGVVDMICSQGRVAAWLASYSTKRLNGPFGPSTARLFQAIPALQPLVEQVARLTRFEGFCGFDWLEENGTGRHYLIEFHPRPPSGFRFGRFCGVDFSAAVSAWLNGNAETFTPLVQSNGKAVAANYFTADLTRCLRERDWPGLKSWCPGNGVCHDVFWDDLPLFLGWAATRLRERWRVQ